MKICNKCEFEKPQDDFAEGRNTCKLCRLEQKKTAYRKARAEGRIAPSTYEYPLFSRLARNVNRGTKLRSGTGKVTAKELETHLGNPTTCYLCSLPFNDDFEVDHIIPLTKGGKTEVENLAYIHSKCNRMKMNLTNEELVDWCRRVINTLKN